jgi:O-antigen ligase
VHRRLASSTLTAGLDAPRGAQAPVAVRLSPGEVSQRVHPIVVWTLCIMMASFLFELPRQGLPVEVSTLTATLFLLATFLQPRACWGRTHPALLWLLAYLQVFAVSAIWHGWVDATEVAKLFFLLVQALLVGWATFNVMQHDATARKALWWFAIACLVRAALPMVGIGRTPLLEAGGERITAFGQDPNGSAVLLAAGLLTLLGLTHGPSRSALRPRFLAWPLAAFLAIAVVETGSRGGLLALVTGLLAFGVRPTRTPGSRLRGALIAVVTVGVLATAVQTAGVMKQRLEQAAGPRGMAGREYFFPVLWDMFLEKPVGGWGPFNNQYELVPRASEVWFFPEKISKDPHNMFLELLTATGLVGAVPFLIALALCVRAAWRARRGAYGVLPLALVGLFLVANMSLNQLARKPFWIVLAFAAAGERRLARESAARRMAP